MNENPKILIIEEGFLRKDIAVFLNNHDYDVTLISLNPNLTRKSKTYFDKILNIYNRVLKKNIYYYEDKNIKLRNKSYYNVIKKEINSIQFDYILIFIPYNFTSKIINYLSKHSDVLIAYCWDSINLEKKHQLLKFKNKLNKIYCYDKDSINKFKDIDLKYISNFYYPLEEIELLKENVAHNKISYVGNIADRRDVTIEKILNNIDEKFIYDINLVIHNLNEDVLCKKYNFNYLKGGISLHDYLKITLNSEIVLDIQLNWQNGFTFRIIEASYLKKKVITTNQNAKELKFYHPDNIFIYNDDTKHLLNNFISIPYKQIDEKLIEYYRVDNWLSRILEIK